jgi:hypothetical protein
LNGGMGRRSAAPAAKSVELSRSRRSIGELRPRGSVEEPDGFGLSMLSFLRLGSFGV